MTSLRNCKSWLGLLPSLLVLPLVSCSAAEEGEVEQLEGSDNVATHSGDLVRRGYRARAPKPGAGGQTGSGGAPSANGDCALCAKARACCDAVVRGASSCNLSEQTCAAMRPESRPHYVGACRMWLTTIIRAQTNSGGSAPAACR